MVLQGYDVLCSVELRLLLLVSPVTAGIRGVLVVPDCSGDSSLTVRKMRRSDYIVMGGVDIRRRDRRELESPTGYSQKRIVSIGI